MFDNYSVNVVKQAVVPMNYFHDLITKPRHELLFSFRPHGQAYHCHCGQPVYFRNTQCLNCKGALGYDCELGTLLSLKPLGDGATWVAIDGDESRQYRLCAHVESPTACNWLIPAESEATLCIACSLNRTIPNLESEQNQLYWRRLETAKRRLVAQLLLMGLPVAAKTGDDDNEGLAFDFLEQLPGEGPVMTGHDNGLITINVAEADDANREALRARLREAYRTLLGHLRHESGHYYWDRLVRDSDWLPVVRSVFGDDTLDYTEALEQHYQDGPPPDWPDSFISAYATSHPWEDWAETWAHYLHMTDGLNTAMDFGIDTSQVEPCSEPFTHADLYDPEAQDADVFLSFVNRWISLTAVLNQLSLSVGHRALYPFVIAGPVVAKLQVIHMVIRDQ